MNFLLRNWMYEYDFEHFKLVYANLIKIMVIYLIF